jgi:ABC-type multidrug transport system fused ATPase/permease subunit
MPDKIGLLWNKSTVGRSLSILPRKDQFKILVIVILQIISGFLDLLGVALIGILGSLGVSGVQSQAPGTRVGSVINFLHIDSFSFQEQIAILGFLASAILISRTFISIFLTRRTLFFLSRRGAMITGELTSRLLSKSLLFVQTRSTQEILFSMTTGVSMITLGILGTTVALVADLSLLIIMGVGIFLIDQSIAISSAAFFGIIAFILYKFMNVRANELGKKNQILAVKSSEKIVEALNSYRELVVRNRRAYYSREISTARMNIAETMAEIQFLPNISKYVIETSVILGAILIAGIQFAIHDATQAVGSMTIFLAAATRVAPAVLRIQQGTVQIVGSAGSADSTLALIEELNDVAVSKYLDVPYSKEHKSFVGSLEIKNLSFSYGTEAGLVLNDISMNIPEGSMVAIVGPSGAGKSTLADAILGIIEPDAGSVHISGKSPSEAISSWPGAISYTPQNVMISDGSILENVSLGFAANTFPMEAVEHSLGIAQLENYVRDLPDGINTQVGENGVNLSGGQRQRLGIARAMFTYPKFLVLDEATSSLDGQTEADLSKAIQSIKGHVTVFLIAHRLSTIRFADVVHYMDKGRIVASGTFDEVRRTVKDFDDQANLMGL